MDTFFFILSKIAWIFLSPGNLIIILFTFATFLVLMQRLKWAKIILFLTSLSAFSLMAYPLGDFIMHPLEARFAQPSKLPTHIDGIIVLGGGEDLKRSLSWGRPELGIGGDRYIGAKELANHYPSTPVLFTGGSGSVRLQNTGGEGSIAKQLLTTLGIKPSRLIIESKSRNTYENFKLIKAHLPNPNGTYLLVTSAFHMPRSVGIARKQGINVIAYPVDYHSSAPKYRYFNFDFHANLNTLETAWREWIGLTVYHLTGKTSQWFPAPKTSITKRN